MKIAFLSHLDQNLYLFRLSWMKALIKEGFDVYAIVPMGNYCDKLKNQGINVIFYSIDRKSFNPFKALITIYELYKIFKKEKFIIIQSFIVKPNIYGAIAGKVAGIPIIINTIEGLGYIYTINSIYLKPLRFLVSLLYKAAFKIAKKVIFLNPDDLAQLSCVLDKRRALIIKGTGVDTDYFSVEGVNIKMIKITKDEIGIINNDKLIITMIARLIWSKGIKELVNAANELYKEYKNFVCLIVGEIDTSNPDQISEDFINVTKNEFIKFIGAREDIREILYLTDIYVLPSYREGIPRTVLEAMSMEKPIITTDAPGCRETVENGINGLLVPVKNSKALAKAIEKLVKDKNLREKMGKASREKAVREFSDKIVVGHILQLYKDLQRNYEESQKPN